MPTVSLSRLEEQRKALASEKESKMKEYRDLEKLVSEWFTQGTGIELVRLPFPSAAHMLTSDRPLPISETWAIKLRST
jgi:hypothetical protein